jgi:hypothetical protein
MIAGLAIRIVLALSVSMPALSAGPRSTWQGHIVKLGVVCLERHLYSLPPRL